MGIIPTMMENEVKNKKSTRVEPDIVRFFGKHIRSWTQTPRGIYVEPKEAIFQYLIFEPEALGFLVPEAKWHITAIYEYVGTDEMDENAARCYRELKSMECELELQGLLRKSIVGRPRRFLAELQCHIPELKISDSLSEILIQNHTVRKLLQSIKPERISIALLSVPMKNYLPFALSSQRAIQGMIEFFKKPESITWTVTLSTMLPRSIGVIKKADEIFRLLDEICNVTRVLSQKNRA